MGSMNSDNSDFFGSSKREVPHNLSTTYGEKMARHKEKVESILGLLADFEVYTSAQNVALLLGCTVANARRALSRLEEMGYLKSEPHFLNGNPGKEQRQSSKEKRPSAQVTNEQHQSSKEKRPSAQVTKVFGITPNGLAYADADLDAPVFEIGRQKSDHVRHKLESQRIRIVCQQIGGSVISERKMRIRGRLKKIPDLLWTDDDGRRIAIEVERELKNAKSMPDILNKHLAQIELDELYDHVLYLVPEKLVRRATKLLASTPVSDPPFRDGLPGKRKHRFAVWPLEQFTSNIVQVGANEKFEIAVSLPIDPSTLE